MLSLDAKKTEFYPSGVCTVPLSQVSTVAFLYSSERPVCLSLVDGQGEIIPCGSFPTTPLDWHKLELRNYTGLRLEVIQDDEQADPVGLWVQLDVRHKTGEYIDPTPVEVPVDSPREISVRERTRRTVLQTLMSLNVMPDDQQMSALEADLGFDFEADEFGDFFEDEQSNETVNTPDPKPEPQPDPEPDPEPASDDA